MYRLFCICCAMALLRGMGSTYAQERVSVPVTITLEAPSAPEVSAESALNLHTSELDVTVGNSQSFLVLPDPVSAGTVLVSLSVIDVPSDGDPDDLILSPLSFTLTD